MNLNDTVRNPKRKTTQRSAILWNETGADDFRFLSKIHDNEIVTRSLLKAMVQDEARLEAQNKSGYYKVETTHGRINMGAEFGVYQSIYQALADANHFAFDVGAYYERIAPEKRTYLSHQELLQLTREEMDLPKDFKVAGVGNETYALVQEKIDGGFEQIVDWTQDDVSYEVKDGAALVTKNPLFLQDFNQTMYDLLDKTEKEKGYLSPEQDTLKRQLFEFNRTQSLEARLSRLTETSNQKSQAHSVNTAPSTNTPMHRFISFDNVVPGSYDARTQTARYAYTVSDTIEHQLHAFECEVDVRIPNSANRKIEISAERYFKDPLLDHCPNVMNWRESRKDFEAAFSLEERSLIFEDYLAKGNAVDVTPVVEGRDEIEDEMNL